MLNAARTGNWDEVVKLESACVLLISQLKRAAHQQALAPDDARRKTRASCSASCSTTPDPEPRRALDRRPAT